MNSWLEFEKRFREISEKLSHARIDHQWGAAGEYWRIAGLARVPAVQEFELLTALAGTYLLQTLKEPTSDTEFIFSETDHKIRWYRALRAWSGAFKSDLFGYQTDETGAFTGNILSGNMYEPALLSANLCLKLFADHPPPQEPIRPNIWDEYGSKIIVGVTIAGITALGGLLFKFLLG